MPGELLALYGCATIAAVMALLVMMMANARGYRNHSAVTGCLNITLLVIVTPCAVGLALLFCGSVQGALSCFVTVIIVGALWLAGAMVYLVFVV